MQWHIRDNKKYLLLFYNLLLSLNVPALEDIQVPLEHLVKTWENL